jgi:hypothetical protein
VAPLLFERRHITPRRRSNSDVAAFRAKVRAMVYGAPRFMLPLMHHFVQQCVHGFAPPMTRNVSARHDNLGRRMP